ncbi:hypothetical protein FHN55_13665 [Streptomyces sp. NP160]|uniref:hypothetical protein n=1 Tax=Streptomyces sp. NP160 TaxID=2586637 RepID=UPI00111A606A|nr:hypothetical protein [Streptomyces sp. NP160]TNM64559.1 hypothetical protein FHN55_13665 [Streptomyces sp. NP160]
MIAAAGGDRRRAGIRVRRSRAGAVGLAAGAVLAAALLTGCGGAPLAAESGPEISSGSSSSSPEQTAPLWPDPAQTLVTTPKGVRPAAEPVDVVAFPEIEWLAEERGLTLEQAAQEFQDSQTYGPWSERARALLGSQLSQVAWRDPDVPDGRPYIAYRGDLPPELVTLAEELPFPVELRGGAVLTDAERELFQNAALEAFEADVAPRNWGGGMDAPTGVLQIDYVAEDARKRADDATRQLVIAAGSAAVGREVPVTVEFLTDDRDPKTTEAATWFLPAGWVADPSATSVDVLVEAQGCTGGKGAVGRLADPVVEVTPTEVRISTPVYILKDGQTCPGHPMAPLTVELGQPLGDRTLVDVNGTIDDDTAPPGGGVVIPSAG